MAVSKKWASTISVVASSLFAFIIVFQIPLFRVACRNKTCESPLEVISSQLVESELVPSPLVKTLLYPGAIAKSLLRGSPLPSYHNLFHFYHFDHLNTPSSSDDDDIRHLEVFAGCCLCLLGALLSIFKPRRLTFIGTLLIYWGLLRDILLFNSSARVFPTLFLASLSAFLSIRSDVRKIIQSADNLAAHASGSAENRAVEKTAFDVKLEKFEAASKIKVNKEIRVFTELGLKGAGGDENPRGTTILAMFEQQPAFKSARKILESASGLMLNRECSFREQRGVVAHRIHRIHL
uniref:Uncharacterized protein n=1 Tax=Brassica campestris TaxID=3711 RepID=A0A3P6A790_BRACM|nr:unnamed protein product [Brassica rapa]